jgi:hypothetical protein
VAKVNNATELLEASHLPVLELALGAGRHGPAPEDPASAVAAGIGELRTEAGRAMHIRRRDLAEQMIELRACAAKHVSVIKHMRSRIEQEQADFDTSGAKIHAVRSVHLKLLREVFNLLSTSDPQGRTGGAHACAETAGHQAGRQKSLRADLLRLREGLQKVPGHQQRNPVHADGTFRQLNAEFSFSLQAPKEPELIRYERDLELIERSHQQYLGVATR